MSVFGFIFKYLRKTKFMAFAILLALIFRSVAERGQVYAIAQVIGLLPQYAEDKTVLHGVCGYIGLLAAMLLLDAFGAYVWRYMAGKFMPYFCSLVYKDIFVAVHHHSIRFFNEEMSGKIASKTKNIVSGIKEIYGQFIFGFIRPIAGLFITMFLICSANFELGLIIFALNMFFMSVMLYIRKRIGSFAEKRARFGTETDGVFIDTVTNSDLVKSFANYFYEKKHFYNVLKSAVRAEQLERTKDAWFDFEGKICFMFTYTASCVAVIYFWYLQKIGLADVVLATSLLNGLIFDATNIGYFVGEFSQSYGQVKDGLNLIFQPCLVQDLPTAHNIKMRNRSICFDNIDFCYPQKEKLFHKFSLKIKSGQKIGLVGHSGSGKSTLVKLLVRYFDVCGGKILVGGEDISKVRQESLRAQIAVIPQDTTLFNRTIRENIRYGRLDATDAEVEEAAKKAFADKFIKELPDGYESKVGERGVLLSGGERQRIAIARAILKNAPILILDEATSALDSQSESYIQKSLKNLMKGKTVIAIAHRLSTLKEMDSLVVMDKGKIAEQGSHEELLAQKGAYYKFYHLQNFEHSDSK